MEIVEIAEFLSAFAAFMTVCFAIVELSARSKAKKADEAIEVYANLLFVCQQIDYIVGSAESFTRKCATISEKERRSYAKTHLPNPALDALIHNIEKESICNFNYTSEEGRANSAIILEFTQSALHTLITANTFYQTITDHEQYPLSSITQNCAELKAAHTELLQITNNAQDILRKRLKKVHNSSNIYLISLGIASIFFFATSFFLRLL